jgi:hypothetical protein
MKQWPVSAWAHAAIALLGATILAPVLGFATYWALQALPQPAGHMDSEGWGAFGSTLFALQAAAVSWVIGLIWILVAQRRWAAKRRSGNPVQSA